jgi:hypothetical protein
VLRAFSVNIWIYRKYGIINWEDNIKMDLQVVGGFCGDWMERAEDRDRWRALVM